MWSQHINCVEPGLSWRTPATQGKLSRTQAVSMSSFGKQVHLGLQVRVF